MGGVVVVVAGSTHWQADEILGTDELQAPAYAGMVPVYMPPAVKEAQKAEAEAPLAPLRARPQLSEQAAWTVAAPRRPTAWARWRRRITAGYVQTSVVPERQKCKLVNE